LRVGEFFETPHDGRPDFVISITAYLDETNQTSGSEHVVVAGFYGDCDQWNNFPSLWREGLGKKSRLHMNDLRWAGKHAIRRTRDLIAKLGSIPHKAKLRPIFGAVKVSDYSDLVATEPKHDGRVIINGYVLCLSLVMSRLALTLPPDAAVKIVCERQDTYALLANMLFGDASKRYARNPQHPYFKSIEFIEKGGSVAIEPADFLAFAVGKYLDENGSRKDQWCRPIFGGIEPKKFGYVYEGSKARESVLRIQRNTRLAYKSGIFI